MFGNAWNSFRKYVGFEKPELFANRYMAEMDARIQKGLKNRQSILDVYQIEMKKIEELQAGIVSPPKSVWKTSRYKERRIHALNKVITDYKSIFSRQIDDRFDEATLFNIKMQSGDHRRREQFLDNVRQSGLSQVLGEKDESHRRFINSFNSAENNIYHHGNYENCLLSYRLTNTGERSPLQLKNKIEDYLSPIDKKQDHPDVEDTTIINILEGDVYKEISDALNHFSALTLIQKIPDKRISKDNAIEPNPVYKTAYSCTSYFRKLMSFTQLVQEGNYKIDPAIKVQGENTFESKIKGLAKSIGFADAPNNPISNILKMPKGWEFMIKNHPKILIEVMAGYMCENLDKVCLEALRTSGNIKQIDNEQYVKLFAIRQAISRITCGFSLHQVQEKIANEMISKSYWEKVKSLRENEQNEASNLTQTLKTQNNINTQIENLNTEIKKLKGSKLINVLESLEQNRKKERNQRLSQTIDYVNKIVAEADSYLTMNPQNRFKSDNQYLLALAKNIEKGVDLLDYKSYFLSDEIAEKLKYLFQFCNLGEEKGFEKYCEAKASETHDPKYTKLLDPKYTKSHDNQLKDVFDDYMKEVCSKRQEIMKSIFKTTNCKLSDFNELNDFLYMVFSGTTDIENDPAHQTGLNYMVKYYPKLLAQFTFTILSRSMLSSDDWRKKIQKNKATMLICDNFLSSEDRIIMKRCMSLIKAEYRKGVVEPATKVQPEYFQDYTFWENMRILKDHESNTIKDNKDNDLFDLSSNNIDKLERLSKKHKDDSYLQSYINNRKKSIYCIDQIEKAGPDFKIMSSIKPITSKMLSFTNFAYLSSLVHTPAYPCNIGNSWSVALSEMLFCKGVKLDQQDIRCYQPVPSTSENTTNYEVLHKQNMGLPSEISDHMNLISKVHKGVALHKINIDKGDESLMKFMNEKILSTVKNHKSPLIYCYDNNYKIITGIKKDQVSWYDPLTKGENLANVTAFGKDFMLDLSNGKPVSLYWLTDIAPEFHFACGNSVSSEITLEKNNKKDPTQKLCRITDNYEHENYNAFELKNSDKNKDNDFMHEYIYLPKREFKNA